MDIVKPQPKPATRPEAPKRRRRFGVIRRLISRVKISVKRRLNSKIKISIAVLLLCGLTAYASIYIYSSLHKSTATVSTAASPQYFHETGTLTKGTPSYKTLLPAGKTIDQLGGWTRVSPPDRNPVFAFADSIAGTPIIVSEQPLPSDFQTDATEQVSLLAEGYHASKHLKVGDVSVYIGTSAKGPQSVIFTENDLLILIKAQAVISDDHWVGYINSLH